MVECSTDDTLPDASSVEGNNSSILLNDLDCTLPDASTEADTLLEVSSDFSLPDASPDISSSSSGMKTHCNDLGVTNCVWFNR